MTELTKDEKGRITQTTQLKDGRVLKEVLLGHEGKPQYAIYQYTLNNEVISKEVYNKLLREN